MKSPSNSTKEVIKKIWSNEYDSVCFIHNDCKHLHSSVGKVYGKLEGCKDNKTPAKAFTPPAETKMGTRL